MRLKGKIAIVTGGAGGLGGATAKLMAGEGATVVITDVSEAAGQALAAELGGSFVRHDVSSEDDWATITDQVVSRHGRIDVLVNAAGIEGDLSAAGGLSTTYAEWRRVLSINLDGTFLGCRAVAARMLERGAGSIVNISSIVSVMATPTALAYGASKAGVEQLTRSIATIGAKDGARVRCNSVHPGVIKTRMTDNIIAEFAKLGQTTPERAEAAIVQAVPFGVRGLPLDVANLVTFLASDEAGYITGSAFQVDGGWHMVSAG